MGILAQPGQYTFQGVSLPTGCIVAKCEVNIIRKSAPIHVIVHYPTTEAGKTELARRVADVHAESVMAAVNRLNCPNKQKLELLDTVIDTAKRGQKEIER